MDRRTFLASTGAAAATFAAGCLDGNGGGDDQPALEPMTTWALPATDEDPLWGYRISSSSVSRMVDVAQEMDGVNGSDAGGSYSLTWGEVDPRDLRQFVSVVPMGVGDRNPYIVYRGSFDDEAARDTLAEASGRQSESHAGYDLYGDVSLEARSDATVAYAVGDETVIQINESYSGPGTTEQARRVVDVAEGDVERVTETSEPIRAVASRLEPGVSSRLERQPANQSGGNGRYADVTAIGSYVARDDESFRRHVVFVFADEAAADADLFEQHATDAYDEFDLDASTVDVDGTVVTGSGELSSDELL